MVGRRRRETPEQRVRRRTKAWERALGMRPHDWTPQFKDWNNGHEWVWRCSKCAARCLKPSEALRTCGEEAVRYVTEI